MYKTEHRARRKLMHCYVREKRRGGRLSKHSGKLHHFDPDLRLEGSASEWLKRESISQLGYLKQLSQDQHVVTSVDDIRGLYKSLNNYGAGNEPSVNIDDETQFPRLPNVSAVMKAPQQQLSEFFQCHDISEEHLVEYDFDDDQWVYVPKTISKQHRYTTIDGTNSSVISSKSSNSRWLLVEDCTYPLSENETSSYFDEEEIIMKDEDDALVDDESVCDSNESKKSFFFEEDE